MKKNRFLVIFIFAFLLNFCVHNFSFADETAIVQTFYPDFSYEFAGFDKYEKFNRKMFKFNLGFNKYIVSPLNIAWTSVMPQYGIDRIDNFYKNIKYPTRLFSCLFQKDFHGAGHESKRFLINTTIGVVGLYNPARNKFDMEPWDENMSQVLAHYKIKQGPYIVLPIIAYGSRRDVIGQILDYPFDPTTYVVGVGSLISTGVSTLNDTTNLQPIAKSLSMDYADSYTPTKQASGIQDYIGAKNYDRDEVLFEHAPAEKVININNENTKYVVNPDVQLNHFHSQGARVDTLRTMFFDQRNLNASKWSYLSVWNKSFHKKLKIGSVNLSLLKPDYQYRYLLQKDKSAPVAIFYPSIGENIRSAQTEALANMLYDEGYSVIMLGSSFNWEFVKSMPENYRPGLPAQDAYYMRNATSKILRNLDLKQNKKIVVGISFGALTSLFVDEQEQKENTIGVSKYVAINPPIQLLFAMKQLDSFCECWKKDPANLKDNAATASSKVMKLTKDIYDKRVKVEALPFNDDEAQLAISFAMRQKLTDLMFTIEKGSTGNKSNLYSIINNTSFYDYAQKYLLSTQNKTVEQADYDSSLYSISDFLKTSNNFRIYHTLDDCFTNTEQIKWLKNETKNKMVLFSNGGHLGYLYRKEFFDQIKADTSLSNL